MKYRFTGDYAHVFPSIPDPSGRGVLRCKPGDVVDLDVHGTVPALLAPVPAPVKAAGKATQKPA